MKRFVVSCFILLASAGSVLAHEQLAAIEGTVRDLRGNPIAGATVYAYDTAHTMGRFIRLETISQSDGKFVCNYLGGLRKL
jgi:protocatechuate 3,4-dioxygenase beta subunit